MTAHVYIPSLLRRRLISSESELAPAFSMFHSARHAAAALTAVHAIVPLGAAFI
jgi:hypothetical protein